MEQKLVIEAVCGERYEFVPLGKHIVSAPGVCRGRPTFKYTRIEVSGILRLLASGESIEEIAKGYNGKICKEAIAEAIDLAARALARQRPRRLAPV